MPHIHRAPPCALLDFLPEPGVNFGDMALAVRSARAPEREPGLFLIFQEASLATKTQPEEIAEAT